MILSFSQTLNGKPTYFIEKIWQSLKDTEAAEQYRKFQIIHYEMFGRHWDGSENFPDWKGQKKPKRHTIRAIRKSKDGVPVAKQWGKGDLIHPAINNRTPLYFQFAPTMKVMSTERIFMTDFNGLEVTVGDRYMYKYDLAILAENDGFDSLSDFEDYFLGQMVDGEFSGKIIHWTDLRYDQ